MKNIVKSFIEITKIGRCSYSSDIMKEYLITLAKELNYSVEVDSYGNILAKKSNPKIALQAHYDMVCVGDAPDIELIIEDNTIRAKNSSLGADNGVAIAMMIELMSQGVEAEFLFTNDEEVGLIGAKNLNLNIYSPYMLNLDSEEEASVYIGCAGGADIVATLNGDLIEIDSSYNFYKVSVTEQKGGHSGVDIDKGIPSAIKILSNFLTDKGIEYLATIKGGERRNSIPANCYCIVATKSKLYDVDNIEVEKLDSRFNVFKDSRDIIELIESFPHGVISENQEFNIPDVSINLAEIESINRTIEFIATARAMSEDRLKDIVKESINILKSYNFKVKIEDEYPAWRPDINKFTKVVEKSLKKVFKKCDIKAIHAGLECGVLSQKLPNCKFASIGPNIYYPHSKDEFVEIESIEKTYMAVEEIVKSVLNQP